MAEENKEKSVSKITTGIKEFQLTLAEMMKVKGGLVPVAVAVMLALQTPLQLMGMIVRFPVKK